MMSVLAALVKNSKTVTELKAFRDRFSLKARSAEE
jgi:hypothetical protein